MALVRRRLRGLQELWDEPGRVGVRAGRDVLGAAAVGCRVGRRVALLADDVDDLGAEVIARDIAKKIEEELQYPGQIKVMTIRETRSSATAK